MEYASEHLQRMVNDFEAQGYTTVWKVLKGHEQGVPQKRERVFIVSVRNDVLDAIGMPFMCLSGLYPDPEEVSPTIRDAIEDIQSDSNNVKESKELYKKIEMKFVDLFPAWV